MHSILAAAKRAKHQDLGFPMAVVENALPEAYYAELAATFPSFELVVGGRELRNNQPYRMGARESLDNPQVPAIWQEFIAYHCSQEFFDELADVFGTEIAAAHPDLERNFGRPLEAFRVETRHGGKGENEENALYDVVLDCQLVYNSPVTERSSVRGPHLDSENKLFAALLYFRLPEDESSGGDLEFQRLVGGRFPRPKPQRIDPRTVETLARVPYCANTLAFFVNTPRSIHGVTPRSITPVPRRYVNFLAECYAGRSDEFFTSPIPMAPKALRKAIRLWNRYT